MLAYLSKIGNFGEFGIQKMKFKTRQIPEIRRGLSKR
jgi:hypothetical protein